MSKHQGGSAESIWHLPHVSFCLGPLRTPRINSMGVFRGCSHLPSSPWPFSPADLCDMREVGPRTPKNNSTWKQAADSSLFPGIALSRRAQPAWKHSREWGMLHIPASSTAGCLVPGWRSRRASQPSPGLARPTPTIYWPGREVPGGHLAPPAMQGIGAGGLSKPLLAIASRNSFL